MVYNLDIDAGDGQIVTFLLNDKYEQLQHVFGAIGKFLRISPSRMRHRELSVENGQTRVRFHLTETNSNLLSNNNNNNNDENNQSSGVATTAASNCQLIADLREIVESDKFTIIDLSIHKTVRAVKGSLRCGPRGEQLSGVSMAKTSSANETRTARFAIEFKPTAVGRYRIDLTDSHGVEKRRDRQLPPFFVNVYDPTAFQIVRRPENLVIGTENIIEGKSIRLLLVFCLILIYILFNSS